MLRNILPTITDMTALAVHAEPVSIFKLYKVMVVDLSMFLPVRIIGRITPDLSTAMAIGFDRIGTLDPIYDIGVMDMLLHDVITA